MTDYVTVYHFFVPHRLTWSDWGASWPALEAAKRPRPSPSRRGSAAIPRGRRGGGRR